MSKHAYRSDFAKLDAVYATLPTVACRGLCSLACGPILMSQLEGERLRRTDRDRRSPSTRADLSCIYLTPTKRCGVYAVRPLICRVWGLVKRMSCMHGCEPTRWLTDHEFVAIAKTIERIGGPIVQSALGGIEIRGDSFLTLDVSSTPPELAEAMAERTRGLRALHGGRIIGVTPRGEGVGWIDIDAVRRKRDGRPE